MEKRTGLSAAPELRWAFSTGSILPQVATARSISAAAPRWSLAAIRFSLQERWSIRGPAPVANGGWTRLGEYMAGLAQSLQFHHVDNPTPSTARPQLEGDTSHGSLGELLKPNSGTVAQEMTLLDRRGVIIAIIASWRTAPSLGSADRVLRIGDRFWDVCREMHPSLKLQSLRRGIADVIAGRIPAFTHAYALGPQRRWHVFISPLKVGDASLFVALHEDIAERPDGTVASDAKPHDLLAVQEGERRRITMELHDSTSQHLAALGLGMIRLRRLVGARGTQDLLEDMSSSIQEVVKEIRVLSYLMRPAGLEEYGLERSAHAFAEGFGIRTGLAVTTRALGPVDLTSEPVRHAAFRIIQEALSNVYRHAKASRVDIEIESRDGVLSVRIADDGRGIEKNREGHPEAFRPGVGIDSMRARAAELHGELEITCPGLGTVVTARLPAHERGSA